MDDMDDKQPRAERIVFAWLRFHESARAHAMVDTYADHSPEFVIESLDGIAAEPDEAPWLRYGSTLCGVSATAHEQLQVTPDDNFSPSGVPGHQWMSVCVACARRWSAHFAPEISGWTKTCAGCRQDLSITAFRGDSRTRDNLSNRCESCHQAETEVRAELREIEAEMARREIRHGRAVTEASVAAASLQKWQDAAWLPIFRCQAEHQLVPEVLGEDVAWLCRCGTASVDQRVIDICLQINHHDQPLWDADFGRIEIATSDDRP
jgi:hypothetical protein